MRLILIRHYKTEFNVSGKVMGWGDSPRAKEWLEDSSAVEQVLRSHGIVPDLIVSSALERSRNTAEYFAGQLQVARLETALELNEINYGSLYGKCKKSVSARYPRHKKDADFVYPDGESFNQVQARAVAYTRQLVLSMVGQTVLCVVHAGVIRALLSYFLELDFTAQLKRKVSHRYTGVLTFQGDSCVGYDEWGQPSGFVEAGVVGLPYTRRSA